MDDNATDLGNMLNDAPIVDTAAAAPAGQGDQGEQRQAEPPAAKQEPDLVPRAALMDERRKRQELEQWVQQNKPAAAPPKAADFESTEAYIEHVAERMAQQQFEKMQQAQSQQQAQSVVASDQAELMSAGAAKYADFNAVVGSDALPITAAMVNAMLAVDDGHEVAYHLGKNPAEAQRIAALPPTSQAKEIRQIVKRLATPAPAVALPATLTTTRSSDGRFSGAQAWSGPSPLNDILGKRN